jgi:tape measure domain-containing protein
MAGNDKTVTLRIAAEDAYSTVLAEVKRGLADLANQGAASADRLRNAFANLNIKSSFDLDAEKQRMIDTVNRIKAEAQNSFDAIKNSGVASSEEIKRAHDALQQKIKQLDEVVKNWGVPAGVKAAEAAIKELAAQGQASLDRLSGAFRTLNIKSSLDVDAERAKLVAAFEQIKNSGVATADEVVRAERAMKTGLADLDNQVNSSPLKRALADYEAALERLAANGQQSVDRLSRAFGALNIKSGLDIEAEKQKIIAAFNQIKNSGVASADEITRAEAAMKAKLDEMNGTTVPAMKTGFGELGQVVMGAFSIQAIKAFIQASLEASMQMESIVSKLKVLTGSQKGAAEEFNYIRAEAKRLGLDLESTAQAYSSFAIATKNTAMEGKPAREMFSAMSEAMTALHLPADKAAAVLYQFQQMLSKGKVNMADLKVASESFPGLMQMIADSIGITTGQLMQQMEAGTLMAVDVLPKLSDQLHKTYGAAAEEAAGKGRAAFNRMTTAMFEMKTQMGSDIMPGIVEIGNGLIWLTKGVVAGFQLIGATAAKVLTTIEINLDMTLTKAQKKQRFQENTDRYEETLREIENKYLKSNNNISKIETDGIAETIRNNQRRRDSAKKTGEDLAKINTEYAKHTGDVEAAITALYERNYQERKKAITDLYNQKKANAKTDQDEFLIADEMAGKLKKLEEQHAQDIKLIAINKKQALLKTAQESSESQIAVIHQQIASHELSVEEGNNKILALQRDLAAKTLLLAQQEEIEYAAIYGTATEEYKKLVVAKENAFQKFIKLETDGTKLSEEQQNKARELSAEKYQTILTKELNDQQSNYASQLLAEKDRYASGAISRQEYEANVALIESEARVSRLAAETEYTEKVVSLQKAALAKINPETQAEAYQKALELLLKAEGDYNAKRNELSMAQRDRDKANLDALAKDTKDFFAEAERSSEKSAAALRARAADFYAAWDNAVNGAAAAVAKLGDNAYNAFASAVGLPVKVTESLDSMTKAAQIADAEFMKLRKEQYDTSVLFGAAWFDAYHRMLEYGVQAAAVTREYAKQRLAAGTLAEQLGSLKLANLGIVSSASEAINKFKLLDESTLAKVKGEIERLKGVIEGFRDSVKSTVAQIKDDLDELTMTESELENKRYRNQTEALKKQLAEARALQDTESERQLNQALANAEKIHKVKLANLKTEQSTTTSSSSDATGGMKFNRGGRLPGNSPFDSLQVWARPGEWFINNEAANEWGDTFMAGVNNPLSEVGRRIKARMAGLPNRFDMSALPMPKLRFAAGGQVVGQGTASGSPITQINHITVQELNEATIRRTVLPVLEKVTRLKK